MNVTRPPEIFYVLVNCQTSLNYQRLPKQPVGMDSVDPVSGESVQYSK